MRIKIFSNLSVRARIAIIFSFIIVLLSVFYHNYIKETQYLTFIDSFKHTSSATLLYVKTGLKYGLEEEDWGMICEVLDWAKEDSNRIVFVALYESDGNLFTSYPENMPYNYNELKRINENLSYKDNIYIKSLNLGKTKLGVFELIVGFSTKELRQKQLKSDKVQLTTTLLILIVGLITSFLLAGTITGPLRKLNIVAKKIAGGNYQLRADSDKGGKEIIELSSTFNSMVQQILDSQHKLLSEMTRYNDILDNKNQELTNANESLQTIVRATSQTGEEFLKVFVKNLALAMNAKYAAVMEVFNEGRNIRIIANWDYDHFGQNFEYPIEDTPCEIVIQKGLILFENNVKSKFSNNKYLLDRKINYYLGIPLYDSEEKPIGIISVFDDRAIELNQTNEFIMKIFAARVSSELERIKSEIALKESEIKFRTLSMSAQDAIIMMDSEGRISFWNEAAERIFGYSIVEAMGKDVHVLLAPKEAYPPYIQGMNEFKRTGLGKVIGSIQEMVALTKNGNTLAIELSLSSVLIKGQWEAIGIARDITARKTMEKDLQSAMQNAEQANLAKSEFLANMSHEIRTPMNAIMGFSQILRSKINDENLNSYLESISSSGKNLLGLINDILDLSKIEAGKLSLEYDRVNPYEMLKEIRNIFSFEIKEKGLDFIIDIDNDIPQALILDEIRLRQILVNLVGNALKFTDKGYIKVSVKRENQIENADNLKLRFCVEDTGIGIPQKELERIFDAFIQQSGQSTRKYGGTGLGLAISRRLVDLMGGKIYVESENDKGSKFIVILDNIAVATNLSINMTTQNSEEIQVTRQEIHFQDDEKISEELRTIFHKRILPERDRLKSGLIIGQVSEFAKELKELSKIHQNNNLMRIAEQLNIQAINFDIVNLKRTLEDLDNFIV